MEKSKFFITDFYINDKFYYSSGLLIKELDVAIEIAKSTLSLEHADSNNFKIYEVDDYTLLFQKKEKPIFTYKK